MAKTHEALLKAEKEHKRQYLEPSRKHNNEFAPVPSYKDKVQPLPNWCNELITKFQTQSIDKKIKSILFTSTAHRSGSSKMTTTFAMGLANSFHRKVLLIDVNLRTPGVHKFFKNNGGMGLFDVFMNDRQIENIGAKGNLFTVTCNKNFTDKIEGFYDSDKFENFLKKMRKKFDYVILDGPPVTSCPESLVVGAKMDGVILTLESGKTRRSVALKTKNDIVKAGGNIIGIVLNRRKYYIPKSIYKRL